MRTVTFWGLVLCLGGFLMAGSLNPPAAPGGGGTMKTLDEVEPRIPIPGAATAKPAFVINESGSYYLTGDRHCSSYGISVYADDVTIDLCGYSLIGSDTAGSYGIYLYNSSNVTVCNGSVRNFHTGIGGVYATNLDQRVEKVRVRDCGGRGITLPGANHQVIGCTVSNCGSDGISIGISSRAEGNVCYGNGTYGVSLSDGSVAKENTVYSNSSHGIRSDDACTIKGNTAYLNGDDGICAGQTCVITGNAIRENTHDGIDTEGGCVISENSACDNGWHGIEVGAGSTAANNSVYKNGYCGIKAFGAMVRENTVYLNNTTQTDDYGGIHVANYCRVIGNCLTANKKKGIYVYSFGNTIESNIINGTGSGDYGIYFDSTGSYYKGNRARYCAVYYGGSVPSGSGDGGDNISF